MLRSTKVITIGNLKIGRDNKIAIQSMTNTRTKDIDRTLKQIHTLEACGCDIIRVAVLDMEDAIALKTIKENINIPLVADIHFDYRLALQSIASGVDKLRINPGNIGDISKISEVVKACQSKKIPIRVGVNMGSLDKEIIAKYGRSAKALVMSAKKHVDILESLGFYDIVISLKASDVLMTVEAYRLASKQFSYPLHLGITEAGTKFSGSIKSAVGMGILLSEGIGDTIRVSLSADPIEEIKVAKEILASLKLYTKPNLISCPTCGRLQYDMLPIVNEIEAFLETLPEIDLTVAIMGCVVNGPGEAKDADIGIAGGKHQAVLFKKGEIVRNLKQEEIISVLKEEILKLINS
jgi:(E)-4-hydroxy-3-methylbut-2-enyl-diphosphate synthase